MVQERINLFELIREKYLTRMDSVNEDGSATSGNWGHVGRPGERGGSAPGGGHAFMMHNNGSKKSVEKFGRYTSQAKIRVATKNAIKVAKMKLNKAKASGKPTKKAERAQKLYDNVVKRSKSINMTQKSAHNLKRFDPNANKNILTDKKRGKTIKGKFGLSGTRETIHKTFPKTAKKG